MTISEVASSIFDLREAAAEGRPLSSIMNAVDAALLRAFVNDGRPHELKELAGYFVDLYRYEQRHMKRRLKAMDPNRMLRA